MVFSEEDISGFGEEIIRDYLPITKILILTRGERGCSLYFGAEGYRISAFPTNEIEPTGAGDVFGSAFLIKYYETRDPVRSAQFACVAASFEWRKKAVKEYPF